MRHAIVAEDWPRALAQALAAWRETRSPALADLVDALSARIPRRSDGPRLDLQRHWMRTALAYDPMSVGPLCDLVQERLIKADTATPALVERLGADDPILARLLHDGELPKHQRNRIERLCAIARWPDDPRAATVLARWFAHDGFTLDPPHHDGPRVILEVLAELLVRIGDPRAVPIVASCIAQPRARTEELRTIQRALAQQIVDGIPPRVDDPDIVAWATALSPPPATSDVALWDAVAQDPDALAPRMVLADHLLEHGDARGELIALQCAGGEAAQQVADRLIAKHWDSWLGDLALVLVRGESRFERGMLASASLGLFGSPAWAYAATALHRELATVKRWRATNHANIDEYAKMLARRPRLDALEVNARDLPQLGAAKAVWDVRELELALTPYYNQPVPAGYVANLLVQVMRMFPTLEELHVHPPYPDQLAAALPLLARAPSLRRIVVRSWSWLGEDGDQALRALAATFPLVEIDE